MRRVCQILAGVAGFGFGCLEAFRLFWFVKEGVGGERVPGDVAFDATVVTVVWLSVLVTRALWNNNPTQPSGRKMFGATIAVLLLGLFGSAFMFGTVSEVIDSAGEFQKFFDKGTDFFRLFCYVVGLVITIYVSIRLIRSDNTLAPACRAVIPAKIVAVLMFLPVILFVPFEVFSMPLLLHDNRYVDPSHYEATLIWVRLHRIVVGFVFLLLAFRAVGILRGTPNDSSTDDSDGVTAVLPENSETASPSA